MAASSDVVSKSAFAQIIGVSKPRVSQLISEGKIHGPAIQGDGRSAKIVVGIAKQQLSAGLDLDQRAANGTADLAVANQGQDHPVTSPIDTAPREPTTEDLYKQERLRKIQRENEDLEERRREKNGVYVRADAMRSTVIRHVANMIDGFEADLGHWAEELSAETGGSVKEIKLSLRKLFRGTREKLARHSRDLVNDLPEHDEEAIDSGDDSSAA
ncbi:MULTISPECIES: hypothetical protein [Thalassospira]|uniref:Uncharacterized protein n=1 Tax=Thalassospira profundimaris TaxID=502049 RepID=A0A367V7H1_9PROT|nr:MULTISPECIES: hypothetical protein [Thalassospira]KZB73260.1 hypothetical protein AUQ43_18460 [Thalassospira sp. MCCC 1A01148]RCK21093.1 hypothetical protein TH6_15135 [Thalassospira profundimaris]